MKANGQRKVVWEWDSLARVPLGSDDKGLLPADTGVADLPVGVTAEFPKVRARLIMPQDEHGRVAPAERVHDVHYMLLSIASLRDYENVQVPFTAYGLLREMGWGHGGRQTRLMRRCVDHLYGATLEFWGEMPDPIRGEIVEGELRMRLITKRWFPKEEQRTAGGRNVSWVSYDADYFSIVN